MTNFGTVPIFTFGFERSGTTLLSMLLGAHPNLAVPFSPTGLWYRYYQKLGEYGQLRSTADRDCLIRDILQEERIQIWDAAPSPEDISKRISDCEYRTVVSAFHQVYADFHDKGFWALHDIATLYEMPIANHWFPDARFLHIVRDVRDVALSHKSYRYGSSNSCEVALAWREAVRTNLMMGRILGPKRYFVVRFEDLIETPEQTLGNVCDFLGIGFDVSMMNYVEDVNRKVPSSKRSLWPALGGALDRSKIGRWRKELKTYEVAVIHEIASDLMIECGYDVDGQSKSLLKEIYLLGSTLARGGRLRRLRRHFPGAGPDRKDQ